LILCSNALGELYYHIASDILLKKNKLQKEAFTEWAQLLGAGEADLMAMATPDLARLMASKGDGVLTRVKHHVEGVQMHMSEQLDKQTGSELSANDLTWSYATAIKAMAARDDFFDLLSKYE